MSPEVTLRWFRVDLDAELRPADLTLLDDGERARANRFTVDGPRAVFVAARAALRRLLAAELGLSPYELAFSYGPNGKPRLEPQSALHFNLSHSGGAVVIAFAHGTPLGVDVEELRPTVSTLRLARRFFAPEEAAAVENSDGVHRLRAFFHCWTAKEAVLKATGSGLTVPVREVVVDPDPDLPPRVVTFGSDVKEASRWTLLRHETASGWIATVAMRGGEPSLSVEEIPADH